MKSILISIAIIILSMSGGYMLLTGLITGDDMMAVKGGIAVIIGYVIDIDRKLSNLEKRNG